jgi:hypothetical protein
VLETLRVVRGEELGFIARAVLASVFFPHVIGEPLARSIIASAVLC